MYFITYISREIWHAKEWEEDSELASQSSSPSHAWQSARQQEVAPMLWGPPVAHYPPQAPPDVPQTFRVFLRDLVDDF